VFKFCKAALLLAVGLGALDLLQPSVAERAREWVAALAASDDRRAVQRIMAAVTGLSPGHLQALGIGAFLYAGLFTTEGTGLWLAKKWAEYLTVIATLSLVPFEIFEVIRHLSPSRMAALIVNLVVAAYLIHRLRRNPAASP
jgi:uncharacterized membrane protein (DUF2068 family)